MKRVLICSFCVLLSVAMIVFAVASLLDALPKEGKWKGVITQYKPAYPLQPYLISLFYIIGQISILIDVPVLCMTIREEYY